MRHKLRTTGISSAQRSSQLSSNYLRSSEPKNNRQPLAALDHA